MALIELHPQLAETNELLKRIAEALEVMVLHEHGIYIGHCSKPATDPNPKEPVTVSYATDKSTARNQLIELMRGVKGVVEEKELEQDQDDWTRS